VNVADGKGDLPTQLLLVKLHAHYLVRESLVEESVDFGAAAQLQRVHCRRAAAFDGALEVLLQLLDAPERE